MHLGKEAICPPVDVVANEHVVSGCKGPQHRILGGEPAREGTSIRRPLERRQARLQGRSGWIARPAVLVTLMPANFGLSEGRRLVDRGHNGSGRRVRRLPGVDGEGLEAQFSMPEVSALLIALLRHYSVRSRNVKRSDRVTIPTGRPPSSTTTAGKA